MTTPLEIEDAAKALKKEYKAHKVEIRAQEMGANRLKGVLLAWVKSYDTKRKIYEDLGEGDNQYPAAYEGWEVRVRKWPPFKKKKKKKTKKKKKKKTKKKTTKKKPKAGGSSAPKAGPK